MQANGDFYARMNWELNIDPLEFLKNYPYTRTLIYLKSWLDSNYTNLKYLSPILPQDDFEILSEKVTKIIFARVVLMFKEGISTDFQLNMLMLYLFQFLPRAIEEKDEVQLLFLFNCSRGMIESQNSLQRLLKYFCFFADIQSFIPFKISTPENNLVQDAFGHFKQVLNNPRVRIALKTFIDDHLIAENDFPENITIEDCINVLKKTEIEISPQEHLFNGMIGRGQKIYLNFGRIFASCGTDNEKTKACFVKLFFHEGGHELIRTFGKNGYSSFTAKGKEKILENLEAGYCMEKLVFGPFNKKYWLSSNFVKILEEKNYDQLPIFSDPQEISGMEERKIAEFCSGICSAEYDLDYVMWE